jgi:hypothetical protein
MRRSSDFKDPRGGHVRLYWDHIDSPAWRALSNADVRVYISIRRTLQRTNNGNISATLEQLRHSGIRSSSTLASALHRLEALGHIEKTRQGGIAQGGKVCSLYRFTDVESFEFPKLGIQRTRATNEWKKFSTIAEARAAIAPFLRKKNTSKVRPPNRSASMIEPEMPFSDSNFEQVKAHPLRWTKTATVASNGKTH